MLRGGAVVMVISDGWDRGDAALLSREMARLQRSCHRLIWLNPLLGSPNYQPLTRGMQAAMPYIDDFLPAHNLHSLQELARHLNQLGARRPPARSKRPATAEAADQTVTDTTHDGSASASVRRRLNPALAPTFQHPLWGYPNSPGG